MLDTENATSLYVFGACARINPSLSSECVCVNAMVNVYACVGLRCRYKGGTRVYNEHIYTQSTTDAQWKCFPLDYYGFDAAYIDSRIGAIVLVIV